MERPPPNIMRLTKSRNFIPDSGKLLHLRTPHLTETVRIDAGFVEGDEITAHYDPMIAKLIVQGTDRHAALQKLRMALEEYEIAGPITNIEFLKKMCVSPAFVAGDVETGYIEKHREELFEPIKIPIEAWAQAAIGLYIAENHSNIPTSPQPSQSLGFNTGLTGPRTFDLAEIPSDAQTATSPVRVSIQHLGPNTYSVRVGDSQPLHLTSTFDSSNKSLLRTFFPHTRLETTLILDPSSSTLTLFHQTRQYRLQLTAPKWAEKAFGVKDVTNSVLAPMPCKVLRVEVEEGADVKRNQALVVIESMKMETVIRAPHDGRIKRVVHRAGDLCKAGTALVEFAEEEVKEG